MGIAIVTGASSGMGREFVLALDREAQFEEIWVIARRRERLEELEGQTRAKLRPLAMDLTREENWGSFCRSAGGAEAPRGRAGECRRLRPFPPL